jgi:FKBP-type peptidyl-prolyl cis-trans isomerase
MKKQIIIASMALLAACNQATEIEAGTTAADKQAPAELSLQSPAAKFSYAIGMDIGKSLMSLDTKIDRDALIAAITDRLDGKPARMAEDEAAKLKQAVFKKRAEKQAAEREAAGKTNIVEGKKYLAENAKREGVTTTASGLQYEVVKKGDGARPKATDTVKVHYRGTLLDGKEFDSSYKRGQPVSFPLNRVIKGWTEGVQLMNVGSTYKFTIPSELAYGKAGAGADIGPNATLIFDVELLAIEKSSEKK